MATGCRLPAARDYASLPGGSRSATHLSTAIAMSPMVVLVKQNIELRELDKARVVPLSNLPCRVTVTPAEGDRPNQRNTRAHRYRQADFGITPFRPRSRFPEPS
jgi:hypothetical protein